MKSVFVSALFAIGASVPAYAADASAETDARRREVMASKHYVKTCNSQNKKFGKSYAEQFSNYPVSLKCRIPPRYPEKCMSRAKSNEVVGFVFDVDSAGFTQNIRLLHASNDCLIEPAAASLLLWSFKPSPVGATGLETDITFELAK